MHSEKWGLKSILHSIVCGLIYCIRYIIKTKWQQIDVSMQVKLLPNRLFDYGHVVFINDIKLIKFKCVIAFSRVFGFYFVERFFFCPAKTNIRYLKCSSYKSFVWMRPFIGRKLFVKKRFWKILQNARESTYGKFSFCRHNPETSLKRRLWIKCVPVSFIKFSEQLLNTSRWLYLHISL